MPNGTVMLVATNPIQLVVNEFYIAHPYVFWSLALVIIVGGIITKIKGN